MKKPSGRKVIFLLVAAIVIASSLIVASINPAETSPACMPEYMKKHGPENCVTTANSSDASIKVINSGD